MKRKIIRHPRKINEPNILARKKTSVTLKHSKIEADSKIETDSKTKADSKTEADSKIKRL